MNGAPVHEPFDDVADSTDWLPTPLSGLAGVEAALRCQVCKDFYKTPMLTSCHHTFCSICIRRALSNDGKCPLCRTSEQEMKLRNNWSIEEVVTAFTKSRSGVLAFAQRSDVATDSSKRKLEADDLESVGQPSGKRLRSSARLSKSKSIEMTSEMARLEANDIPDQDPTYIEYDDGLVECPICLQRMKPIQVDRHLDTSCPGEPQPQQDSPSKQNSPSKQSSRSTSTPSIFPSPTPFRGASKNLERLPAINYSMLKEPQLRKKLMELGLSTAGNRQMLERRHKEWMTIWNANCDSQYPRRKTDLMHDLDVWERTLGSRAPTSSRSLNLGAQIKDRDFDGAAWAAKHDTSFKDLIANARRNKPVAAQKVDKTENVRDGNGDGNNEGGDGDGKLAPGAGGEPEPTPRADADMLAMLANPAARGPVDSYNGSPLVDLTDDASTPETKLRGRESEAVEIDPFQLEGR
ncbi:E3 ubiquitin-protein ligase rad18 [Parahypoxylon ruwenzoriense]